MLAFVDGVRHSETIEPRRVTLGCNCQVDTLALVSTRIPIAYFPCSPGLESSPDPFVALQARTQQCG